MTVTAIPLASRVPSLCARHEKPQGDPPHHVHVISRTGSSAAAIRIPAASWPVEYQAPSSPRVADLPGPLDHLAGVRPLLIEDIFPTIRKNIAAINLGAETPGL